METRKKKNNKPRFVKRQNNNSLHELHKMESKEKVLHSTIQTSCNRNAKIYKVEMESYEFVPNVLVIEKGDSIRWIHKSNNNGDVHAVTSVYGYFESPEMVFSDEYAYEFNNVGTFEYYCNIYSFMKGTIVVVDELQEEEKVKLEAYLDNGQSFTKVSGKKQKEKEISMFVQMVLTPHPHAKEDTKSRLKAQLSAWKKTCVSNQDGGGESNNGMVRKEMKKKAENWVQKKEKEDVVKKNQSEVWKKNEVYFPNGWIGDLKPYGDIKGKMHIVTIDDFQFYPNDLKIRVGDVVVFQVMEKWEHAIHAMYTEHPMEEGISNAINYKEQYSWRFTRPGKVHFQCTIYDFMTGTITITNRNHKKNTFRKRKKRNHLKAKAISKAILYDILHQLPTLPTTMETPIDINTMERNSNTMETHMHAMEKNSNTMERNSNTMETNSNTMETSKNTIKRNLNTMERNSNAMETNKNTMETNSIQPTFTPENNFTDWIYQKLQQKPPHFAPNFSDRLVTYFQQRTKIFNQQYKAQQSKFKLKKQPKYYRKPIYTANTFITHLATTSPNL